MHRNRLSTITDPILLAEEARKILQEDVEDFLNQENLDPDYFYKDAPEIKKALTNLGFIESEVDLVKKLEALTEQLNNIEDQGLVDLKPKTTTLEDTHENLRKVFEYLLKITNNMICSLNESSVARKEHQTNHLTFLQYNPIEKVQPPKDSLKIGENRKKRQPQTLFQRTQPTHKEEPRPEQGLKIGKKQ